MDSILGGVSVSFHRSRESRTCDSHARRFDQLGHLPRKKTLYAASIIGLVLIIAYRHYSTDYASPVHGVYAELHYVPVLMAALAFGLRGAALVSAAIVLVYALYLVATWRESWFFLVEHSIHVFFPALFGLLVGFLADLEKKRRAELEKSRYLAGLGQAEAALVHDLKSPVVTIRGFAGRIEQGKGDARVAAKTIDEAARRIEHVIASVLSFAKPIELNRQEEDMSRFIKELCDREKSHGEARKIEVVPVVPETELRFRFDRLFMERALLNVVTNAIEASRPGEKVVVSASTIRRGVIIRVTDTGRGMDRETLENLFIPFYTKKTKGTGLGTAIAKKIVEEHGGRIEVASTQGAGTQVSVILPEDGEDSG